MPQKTTNCFVRSPSAITTSTRADISIIVANITQYGACSPTYRCSLFSSHAYSVRNSDPQPRVLIQVSSSSAAMRRENMQGAFEPQVVRHRWVLLFQMLPIKFAMEKCRVCHET
jgi:hypothetical protein